jgi:hypothetical protein
MNIALEKTEEYVHGVKKRSYGDAFVRGNNGKFPLYSPSYSLWEKWRTNATGLPVMYISADWWYPLDSEVNLSAAEGRLIVSWSQHVSGTDFLSRLISITPILERSTWGHVLWLQTPWSNGKKRTALAFSPALIIGDGIMIFRL